MKRNLQLLGAFVFSIITCTAQETPEPVFNKTNRIILHFDDTTGLFTQFGRLLINRGYDIEWKDREFGIIRTQSRVSSLTPRYPVKVKTIFRDSTVTLYADEQYPNGFYQEIMYTTKKRFPYSTSSKFWLELMEIAELLKPKTITYSRFEQDYLSQY